MLHPDIEPHGRIERGPLVQEQMGQLVVEYAELPRIGTGADLSATTADFLTAWLIEGKPEQALAYLAEQSYPCVLEFHEHPDGTDLAPLRMLASMRETGAQVGEVENLSAVVAPIPVSNVRMRQLEHENDDVFTLLRVPPEFVVTLPCPAPGRQAVTRTVGRDEGYATSFRITEASGQQADLFFLWEQHGDYWKIVTFHLDVSLDAGAALELALEHFLPRMPKGSIIVFDELNCPEWPGETIAALEHLKLSEHEIRKFPFEGNISYLKL